MPLTYKWRRISISPSSDGRSVAAHPGESGCSYRLNEAPFGMDRARGHLDSPDGDLGVRAIDRDLRH